MKDVMGLIFTGENDIHLGELTSLRAVAALPIAGRYRVIDFQLSSMVHSGIKNVGVITQKNYSSLMDHIGSGREWDLHGKQGLVMLPPFLTRENMGVYSGLLDALKSNCTYLRLSRQEYIVLTNSHTIYNMDYTDALKYHIEKGADVTVLYAHGAKAVGTEGENDTFLSVDEDGKVTGMEIGSSVPTRDCASLKVYITKRELLRQLVEQAAANGMHDFDRDILQRNINDGNLRVYGYEYKGLACQIDSIQSYFNFNMSLLSGDVRRQLFPADRPVYTKVRDDLPTRYVEECECSNSLIANGCMIEGTVINSVIFRGVKVAKGAVVKNSIVMQDAQIQEGAEIDHCILDKQSVIRRLLGYCELSLGKIDAVDSSQGEQGQSLSHQGMVIHPFVKLDRVPQILAGIIPEFADVPAGETPLPPVALRRAVIRRGILQGAGFWIAVCVAVSQVIANLVLHNAEPEGQMVLGYLNIGAYAAYAVCLIVLALEVVGAVLWARGSGFAYNRRFMRVVNGGLGCESVSFPRRKIQFGYTKTNPFQRRAQTATIAVRTAAGTGGTTVRLIDVCEDDAQAWLEWVRPRRDAVS